MKMRIYISMCLYFYKEILEKCIKTNKNSYFLAGGTKNGMNEKLATGI